MIQFINELITPSRAKEYLEANTQNRRVKNPVVYRYADDMVNGRWKLDTGETIKISETGIILDGQHRLLAVVKANTSIMFHLAKGLPNNVFDVIDTGSNRNASDIFKIKGVKNENKLPSIISMYNSLKNPDRIRDSHLHHKSTNAMLLEQYYKNEPYWQSVATKSHALYLSFAKILTPSMIGGFYAYFNDLNSLMAENFMEQICTGSGIENETVLLLRNRLIQDKTSLRKISLSHKIALIIKTWNFFIKGDTVKVLKFDIVNDPFPKAISK